MSDGLLTRLKKITAAVIVVMCIFAFASCGDKYEGSTYTGKWECVSARMDGVKINADKVLSDFSITLKADGNASALIDGSQSGGKWEKTHQGIEIKSGDKKLDFQSRDDNLVYSDSGIDIVFKKVK